MTRQGNPSPEQVREVYERLLKRYGPRDWWPGEGPFEVIVGAILTQHTAWSNVTKALSQMREAGIWNFNAVHDTPAEEVAQLVRPSGYFNQKARKLKGFAAFVVDEFGGSLEALFALETAELRGRLLELWGIGEETADDIILYAAGKPSFVIDSYTRRLVQRLGWEVVGNHYADYQALFTERLPKEVPLFNEYHALIDRHGNSTCRKAPLCDDCCLLDICPTGMRRVG